MANVALLAMVGDFAKDEKYTLSLPLMPDCVYVPILKFGGYSVLREGNDFQGAIILRSTILHEVQFQRQ